MCVCVCVVCVVCVWCVCVCGVCGVCGVCVRVCVCLSVLRIDCDLGHILDCLAEHVTIQVGS